MSDTPRIQVKRSRLVGLRQGNMRPIGYLYETHGPDDKRYDNTSIVELRRVLKRRYPGAQIIETWKADAR